MAESSAVTRVLAVAITAVLLAGVVAAVAHDTGSKHPHPDEWDPRVADLAEFVADARDLRFRHPVFVDFLSAAEYTEQTTTPDDEVDDDERSELERHAAELRALGLASGEVDLLSAYNAVSDSGTLAFYDPLDGRVRVRGTELTVGLRVTLVHELTHALQDQHFDLSRIYDDDLDSSASTAFRALVEGDARRIEVAYLEDELTREERSAYDDEYASQLDEAADSTSAVPPFISASFGVPYLLGEPFVAMLANDGGNDAVDAAFRQPPSTEEHLFDPASFLADEGGEDLDLDLDGATEVLDEGPFGSPSWFLLLAERIDPKTAFDAALGWAGDAYATFERKGRACLRAAFAGDTERDDAEMRAALGEWVERLPGGRARLIEVGERPGFEACDPGPEVDMQLTGRVTDALYLPTLWGYLIADATTVLDGKGARCYARAVIDSLTYEEIVDPSGAALVGDSFQERATEAFAACA